MLVVRYVRWPWVSVLTTLSHYLIVLVYIRTLNGRVCTSAPPPVGECCPQSGDPLAPPLISWRVSCIYVLSKTDKTQFSSTVYTRDKQKTVGNIQNPWRQSGGVQWAVRWAGENLRWERFVVQVCFRVRSGREWKWWMVSEWWWKEQLGLGECN